MTLLQDSAYDPRFTDGANTFLFNSLAPTDADPRINILSIDVAESTRVDKYAIPGSDGSVIPGGSKAGLTINISLEVGTNTLGPFTQERADLMEVIGNPTNKFSFYLRYEDSDNYWLYEDCVLISMGTAEGKQDPVNVDPRNTISLSIESESSEPVVKEDGNFIIGTDPEIETGIIIEGSTRVIIADEFIVQNTAGDIKMRLSALLSKMEVVGTIEQTL